MKKELSQEEQEYAQEMLAFLQENQTRIDKLIQKNFKKLAAKNVYKRLPIVF